MKKLLIALFYTLIGVWSTLSFSVYSQDQNPKISLEMEESTPFSESILPLKMDVVRHLLKDCSSESGSLSMFPSGGTPPYSIVWNHSPLHAYHIDNLSAGFYSYTLQDAAGNTVSQDLHLGYQVYWRRLIELKEGANLSLSKGVGNAWNTGAFSENVLHANTNGSLSLRIDQEGINYMFGLSEINDVVGYGKIRFAFYIKNTNELFIYENGTKKATLGSWNIGDELLIKRIGTSIQYLKNGIVQRSVNLTNAPQLQAQATVYSSYGRMPHLTASFCNNPSFMGDIRVAHLSNCKEEDGKIEVVGLIESPIYDINFTSLASTDNIQYGLPKGIYPLELTTHGFTIEKEVFIGSPVQWKRTQNVRLEGDSLYKFFASNSWNAFAQSDASVTASGESILEWTQVENLDNPVYCVGFSSLMNSYIHSQMEHMLFLASSNKVYILEKGIQKQVGMHWGGERYRIHLKNDSVYYYQNDKILKVSGVSPSLTYYPTASVHRWNQRLPIIYTDLCSPYESMCEVFDSREGCISKNSTYELLQENIKTWTEFESLSSEAYRVKHEFTDGLGRIIQEIKVRGNAQDNPLIQDYRYSKMGDEVYRFLPYSSRDTDDYHSNSSAESCDFHANEGSILSANTDFPYSEVSFTRAPSRLPKIIGEVGEEWQISEGHTKKLQYRTNTNYEVIYYRITPLGSIEEAGYYPSGSLLAIHSEDEEGHRGVEFRNLQNEVVLERKFLDNENVDTYYIYDANGKVSFVLEPEFQKKRALGLPLTDVLELHAYRYEYDSQGLLIRKYMPGWDQAALYIYDYKDRLCLLQEPSSSSTNSWIVKKYDEHNRMIFSGQWNSSLSETELRTAVLLGSDEPQEQNEIREIGSLWGYTMNRTFPITGWFPKAIYHFDTYDFDGDGSDNITASGHTYVESSELIKSPKLMPTAIFLLPLEKSQDTLKQYLWYDSYYQNRKTQHIWGKKSIVESTAFSFDFLPTYHGIQYIQSAPFVDNLEIKYRKLYSNSGDLKDCFLRLNDQNEILYKRHHYNELGQLSQTKYHSTDGGNTFLQTEDLQYQVRGWLKSINGGELSDPKDAWALNLEYSEGISPLYNGNISAQHWISRTDSTMRSYRYTYDQLNRLTDATYGSQIVDENYSVSNVNYDLNGNIKSLDRYGVQTYASPSSMTYGLIDRLNYTYLGNRIYSVQDAGFSDGWAEDFIQQSSAGTVSYVFNANGNIIADTNKGISSMKYNYLNLASEVQLSNGNVNRNVYWGNGELARSSFGVPGSNNVVQHFGIVKTEYDSIKTVDLPNGILIHERGSWIWEYHFKDHLGNLRAVVRPSQHQSSVYELTFELDEKSDISVHGTEDTYLIKAAEGLQSGKTTQEEIQMSLTSLKVMKGDTLKISFAVKPNKKQKAFISFNGLLSGLQWIGFKEPIKKQYGEVQLPETKGIHSYWSASTLLDGIQMAFIALKKQKVKAGVSINGREEVKILELETSSKSGWQWYTSEWIAEKDDSVSINTFLKMDQGSYIDAVRIEKITGEGCQYWEDKHYYPFGMSLKGIELSDYQTATEYIENPTSFNSWTDINEEGVHFLQAQFRLQDPALGRFMQMDPMGSSYSSWSAYHLAANNPIRISDPFGLDWYVGNGEGGGDPVWLPNDAEAEALFGSGGYINLGPEMLDEVVVTPDKNYEGRSYQVPNYLSIASKEYGVKENTSKTAHNPRILEYHQTTIDGSTGKPCNTDEAAWCASFVNWAVEQAGLPGNDNLYNATAWSYAKNNQVVEIPAPALGAIALIRNSHVTFVIGVDGKNVIGYGGNQSNQVKVSTYVDPGKVRYFMPKGVKPNYNVPKVVQTISKGKKESTR